MQFPYGTAPFVILLVAVLTGALILSSGTGYESARPDLVLATFTKEHAAAYAKPVTGPIARFEKENNVHVQVQVVSQRALQGRLQSSMQIGAEVPDMVELLDGTLGVFTNGPIEDVGFVDITQRVHDEGLFEKLVQSRFGKWSARGHIFALPHDMHPAMLVYRRDLVEQLEIDVNTLGTWDEFCRVAREVVVKDLDGDGVPDRYMLDLPDDGASLQLLLLQKGGSMFDRDGKVAFDSDATAEVIVWYIHQIAGDHRTSFPAGWGQNLAKAMSDGLVLFYFCPDWRLRQLQTDIPSLSGKLALMPLPAWTPGGLRTSTWGGTGLAITKQSRQKELAWKLAMHLYYDPPELGERFAQTQILPPLRDAWKLPQFDEPSAFFSGQRVGRLYADLAPQVPEERTSPFASLASAKLSEAFSNTMLHFRASGDKGLVEVAKQELKVAADRVRQVMARNKFINDVPTEAGARP